MERVDADASMPEKKSTGDSGMSFAGLTEFLGRPAAPSGEDLGPGSRLGDVTIVRLIDEGGMGRVYEGLQGIPCRTVAVKVIRSGVFSRTAARRFQHEAHILGRLTHPGICRIYSVGMERIPGGQVPYFVMEYLEDALSITAYAEQRDLSTRDRVTLFCEACRAVAHGHQKGVIHRDLKPGNILVDVSGRPKIIDFGVARSTDGDVALTTMHTDIGQLVGTLAYMAPEQFDGQADDLDVRADVYALGVVLYEFLAGALPYDIAKRPVYEVARIVKEVEPQSLSTVKPRMRGDLNTIVGKCLEKDRVRRYSNATELEADLGRYLRGEPIFANPPSLIDSLVRLARRHRAAATAAASILTVLVCAVTGVSLFAVRAERQRELAVAARQTAILEARAAATERDTADRQKARADSEADLARKQLYVANLRALRSCADAKNLRMARQLYAENSTIAGLPLPLEMGCLAAGLDDALVVFDPKVGPITTIKYSPEAGILAVNASMTMLHQEMRSAAMGMYRRNNSETPSYGAKLRSPVRQLFFQVGSGLRYELLETGAGAESSRAIHERESQWIPVWRASTDVRQRLEHDASGAIEILAVSPDGRRMAVHSPDGGVRIVDRATGEDEALLDGHRGKLAIVAFNADGTRLIIQSGNRQPGLWDADLGRLLVRCGRHDRTCQTFRFSPDGSRLAAVFRRSPEATDVIIYDTLDGRELSTVTIESAVVTDDSFNTGLAADDMVISFTPDSRQLITSCHENSLAVWNVADGTLLAGLRGHAAIISAVAASPDNRRIASGAANGHIRIWNAETFAFERELVGHHNGVLTLDFHPDGETLASGSMDGTVRIWSSTRTEPMSVLPGIHGMTAAAFSADGRQLAVAPRGGGVELWSPQTVERQCTLVGGKGSVVQIAYSPDGSLVAAAFESPDPTSDVCVWNAKTGALLTTLGGHKRAVKSVTFNDDGSRVLTTSGDGMAIVWNSLTGSQRMAHATGTRTLLTKTCAVFGLGGRRVASMTPKLIDSDAGHVVAELARQGQVTCLAASPDGRVLATGVAMGTVYLSDFATGERLKRLVGHKGSVLVMAFNTDGSRLVTGGNDGSIRLWNVATGTMLHALLGHEGSVETATFTRDGRRLLTGSTDGTVRIWDTSLGHELLSLPGQRDFPNAVALSPDGMQVVAAASDGNPRIWGLADSEIVTARQAESAAGHEAHDSPPELAGSIPDRGEGRRPHLLRGLLEAAEERREVGDVLPVQAEGLEVR